MNKESTPIIAITPGDPCGVGPEIVVKSLINYPDLYNICRPVVIADPGIMENTIKILNIGHGLNLVDGVEEAGKDADCIDVIDIAVDTEKPVFGRVSAAGGTHAFASIKKSIGLALDKKVHAIATAPINKEALKMAGVPYLDHTEILTRLTDSNDTMTLFVTGTLRVFFYSRHIYFKDIPASLNQTDLLQSMKMSLEYLEKIGIKSPSLALAALNPHGGEQGMFGNEEIEILEPAVQKAQAQNLNIVGPVPADSVFHLAKEGYYDGVLSLYHDPDHDTMKEHHHNIHLAKEGYYDGVLSLYHDQGHIATKTLDFHRTVALTMGLPFLRTSVDHGTAFDIAGKGIASEISLVEAIKAAARYYW